MPRFMTGIVLAGIIFSWIGCANSTRVVRGNEARQWVGEELDLLEETGWSSFVIRDRRAGLLVAAIFAPNNAKFRIVKRQLIKAQSNPYNLLVVNDPQGTPGFAPSPQLLAEIRETGLVPEIVVSPEGEEVARVYRNPGQPMNARIQEDNSVRIELGRRQDRGGSISYSLPIYGVATPAPAVGPTPIKEEDGLSRGDTVSWSQENETRVGTIKSFLGDGTCLINMLTVNGSEEIIVEREILVPIQDGTIK